jgi:hypothetical protein
MSMTGDETITPQSGVTARWTDHSPPTGTSGGQTRSTTGPMGWTWDSSTSFVAHIAVPINAAVVPSGRRRVSNSYW